MTQLRLNYLRGIIAEAVARCDADRPVQVSPLRLTIRELAECASPEQLLAMSRAILSATSDVEPCGAAVLPPVASRSQQEVLA
jgi:hypothetical protein